LRINEESINLWSKMFFTLDEISKKLDWPLKDTTHNQADKVDKLLNLRHGIQSGINTTGLVLDVNKLTKQLSFYGITQFLYELIKLNKTMAYMFNSRLMFNLVANESDAADHNRAYRHEKILKQLEYSLDLWSKLNDYKDVYNVITKCLTNCKLDGTHLVQDFCSEFYYLYKFNMNKPYDRQYVQELMECGSKTLSYKKRIQYISYLFVEKSMYEVMS
jgi:hypothetical protein